jgi:hypothetical protein
MTAAARPATRKAAPPAIDQKQLATEESVTGTPATPAQQPTANGTPADGRQFSAPLLSDAAGLRLEWQRVAAGFVDDPRAAVGEAADLVEQTAQALIGALRQRQQQLRAEWEDAPENGSPAATGASGAPDTEALRLLMQRYRTLFNQLSRP